MTRATDPGDRGTRTLLDQLRAAAADTGTPAVGREVLKTIYEALSQAKIHHRRYAIQPWAGVRVESACQAATQALAGGGNALPSQATVQLARAAVARAWRLHRGAAIVRGIRCELSVYKLNKMV